MHVPQVQQWQAALKQTQAQLRQAEQRSAPGCMVPVSQWREVAVQLEQAQARYDALERQHAALQHRVPGRTGAAGGAAAGKAKCGGGEECVTGEAQQPEQAPLAAAEVPGSSCSVPARSSGGRQYSPEHYGCTPASAGAGAQGTDLPARLLEKDVQLFDAHLQRDQAVQEAERYRRRLHALLDSLSPHPQDAAAAAAVAEARQLAGLPPLPPSAAAGATAGAGVAAGVGRPPGKASTSKAAAGGGKAVRQQPGAREQELLDTIALLKSALERTKKGLESGVSSAKYMQARVCVHESVCVCMCWIVGAMLGCMVA